MTQADELLAEIGVLRERLTRLSRASVSINESLDLETVLQETLDHARDMTEARYGWLVLCDDREWITDYVASGMTAEQGEALWRMPQAIQYFRYLKTADDPVREADLLGFVESQGLPRLKPPFIEGDTYPALATTLRDHGTLIGAIFLLDKDGAFTAEDEEIFSMFASQAALVISNARRHRDDKIARTRLETLINTTPVGVLVFDAQTGELRSKNREALRIVRERLLPHGTVEELLETATFRSPAGHEYHSDELPTAQAMRTGEAVRCEELVIEVGDRSLTTMVNATPIIDDEGAVESVVATVEDITPLADLERMRTEFLGMVGHELRLPLSSIKGSVTTLVESHSSLAPAETAEFFRIINEQCDYMRDLISDLIDVVRIETGTLSVDPEPVDVSRLVDEARNVFLSSGGRDAIRIDIEPDLPPVAAERRRIVQVISNLMINAARSSHETSPISVQAHFDGVHVAVSIADEGRGITADRLTRLFTKFSPQDTPETGRDLGLGLAICRGIVEAHGGRIWAESDGVGLGSRFTFTIPAAQQSGSERGSGGSRVYAHTRDETGLDKDRVLALDDDPRMLKSIRDTLAGAGFEPVVTGDPQQIASLIEQTDPAVVLLDVMLPGTDGIEMMREVAGLRDLPVIFLSAYNRPELIAKAFEMGAVDYVVKPFSPSELAARVRAALRKRPERPSSLTLEDLTINYAQRAVSVAGKPVELSPIEYSVLVELSASPGTALTHEQLLAAAWGPDGTSDARRDPGLAADTPPELLSPQR